jgi:trans-aconitate methyltransferase
LSALESSSNSWDSASYDENTRFVTDYGSDVLTWLAPQAGERVLDLGCGDGPLMTEIAASGATVVGVDTSESFVNSARHAGLDAHVMSGEALEFDNEFDAVFSNAAIHWMNDKPAVARGVARALKPGGRFAGEFGGHGNVAAIITAMYAVGEAMEGNIALAQPGTYPTAKAWQTMLEDAGLVVDRITLFARPTPLPTGVRGWLKTMRGPFFAQFGEREAEAYDRVIAALEPSLKNDVGQWHADYVRLRFAAHRPA